MAPCTVRLSLRESSPRRTLRSHCVSMCNATMTGVLGCACASGVWRDSCDGCTVSFALVARVVRGKGGGHSIICKPCGGPFACVRVCALAVFPGVALAGVAATVGGRVWTGGGMLGAATALLAGD
jgi:hypothetical protein